MCANLYICNSILSNCINLIAIFYIENHDYMNKSIFYSNISYKY